MKIKDIVKETTTAGAIASVNAPVATIQKRIPKNGLDSDNLIGGKKKKPKSKKA